MIIPVGIVIFIFFVLSFVRIDWAICLLIFLCPFHYVFKQIYPSIATDLWREIFLLCILINWFFQVCLRRFLLPRKNILNLMIIAYIFWGAMEIFRSYNLLAGLAGFRFMFAFIPLYFIALSAIKGEREIKRYINAFLISGFIVTVIAVIEFILVSILGIVEPQTSFDFAKGTIFPSAVRLGFIRVTSILLNTNELGNFLFVCLVFVLVFNYFSPAYKRHHKILTFSAIIMLLALLFTMSRNSIISFVTSIIVIALFKKRKVGWKPILAVTLGMIILSLILPFSLKLLFEPVYTFTDPYYEGLRAQEFWGPFWQAPFLGHGFSITPSTAEKLNIAQLGVTSIGGTDNYFLLSSTQIGIIGFSLHFLIWLIFLRNSYWGAKNVFLSEDYRAVSLAIFGLLIGLMVTSLHTSTWEHISFSAFYYVLGAISTFIYSKAKGAGAEGAEV